MSCLFGALLRSASSSMNVEIGDSTSKSVVEPYDPFANRDVKKPNGDIRACVNLIKSSLGSGLLAGPLAFSNAGWGIGLIGTIIVGVICGHCIHILVTTSRACCVRDEKPSLDYAETCRSVFTHGPKPLRRLAKTASIITDFSLVCTYLGVCCIYTVLIGDSVKQLVDNYYPTTIWPVEYYCLVFLAPLCLMCQIPHLKWLAVPSGVATGLLVATVSLCGYYIASKETNFDDKIAIGSPARYPAFLSTVIFAMEGIGVVMPVENAMKTPQHFLGFPSVLSVAMGFIVTLYSILGLFGYFRYGEVLRGSITLNLPMDDWPAICAKVFIALSIFFTYPLQFFVVVEVYTKYAEPHIKQNYRLVAQIVARVIGVCFCVFVGMALPLLEQIINIVGSLFYSILGVVIPGIIETVFRWNDLGKYNWVLWKNCFIVLFGFTCLFSGCTVTILDIIKIQSGETE